MKARSVLPGALRSCRRLSVDPTDWPDDATRDRLIGDWHLYQRTGGHRASTDDLITAWYAIHRNPEPPAGYLDLGCGVGSVSRRRRLTDLTPGSCGFLWTP